MIAVIALWVGYAVMVSAALLIAAGALFCAAFALNKVAWHFWDRAASLYRLETMIYWFRRMSKDGTHVIRKDYEKALDRERQPPP